MPEEDVADNAVPEEAEEDEEDHSYERKNKLSKDGFESPELRPKHSPNQDSATILSSLTKSCEIEEEIKIVVEGIDNDDDPVFEPITKVGNMHKHTPSMVEGDEFTSPEAEARGEQSCSMLADDPIHPQFAD